MMRFLTGTATISMHNSYFSTSIHRLFNNIIHAALVMPGTLIRNREYPKRRASRNVFYINVAVILVIHLISTVLDIMLFLMHLTEVTFALILSPFAALLQPLTGRHDGLNTLLNAIETVFPHVFFDTLDIVIELSIPWCERGSGSGRLVRMGRYRELDWACTSCCAYLTKLKELNADPVILDNLHVRGQVISEYCALTTLKPRIISSSPSLAAASLLTTEFLLHHTFDLPQRRCRRVFVRASNSAFVTPTQPAPIQFVRTEGLNGRVGRLIFRTHPDTADYAALLAFIHTAEQWNRLKRSHFNQLPHAVVQTLAPLVLLAVEMALGVIGAGMPGEDAASAGRNEEAGGSKSKALNALMVAVAAQVAWFEVASEAILLGLPDSTVRQSDFARMGIERARAIRYLSLGEADELF